MLNVLKENFKNNMTMLHDDPRGYMKLYKQRIMEHKMFFFISCMFDASVLAALYFLFF